jgi:hypothetical protein
VKIPSCASSVVRGFATSGAPSVGAVFFARAPAVQSTASDVSAQSADSHNITGSTARVTLAAIGYAFSRADSVFAGEPVRRKAGPGANFGVGNYLSSVRNGFGSDEIFSRCT